MVKIRLTRLGDAHSPVYRVVVSDSKTARDGGVIENIGTYNPLTDPAKIDIKLERAVYWLSVGAQPTETARQILKTAGVSFEKAKKASKPKTGKKAKKTAK